jgi:hypothetical protein
MSKIKKEQLEELQGQEEKKGAILHDLGLLETQKHSLNHIYAELMAEQQKSKTSLEEEYGKININLQDGSYELIKEDDEKNK